MLNVAGLISIIVFYLLILAIGIWAGRKNSKTDGSDDEVILAGRNIGIWVGIFTMTATWVGGGYINGSAEITYTKGMLWCQSPIAYTLSLLFGGIFFAKQMREQEYVTMLDPLQQRLGKRLGGLLYIPALCGDIFFCGLVLAALGSTVSVIIDWDKNLSIIVSAAIAVGYTLFGGLYAVAYTDVAQLFCIFIGLWLAVPFAMTHEAVGSLSMKDIDWFGEIQAHEIPQMLDVLLLMIFGGIAQQTYFQRVLSCKTARGAQLLSYYAAFGSALMAVPGALIGIVAKATDWNLTEYGRENGDGLNPLERGDALMILPLVIHHLTPPAVGLFGLGAVTAAVMSSADSAVLSGASMFARNVYRVILRTRASGTETKWALRSSIVAIGGLGSAIALSTSSVYNLLIITADLVYVILFPQLLLVVHFKDHVNSYGSIVAYFVGFSIRLGSGEPQIGLPPLIHFPGYDRRTGLQQFPFRTFTMVISLLTMVVVSKMADFIFRKAYLGPRCDLFRIVENTRTEKNHESVKKSNVAQEEYKNEEATRI